MLRTRSPRAHFLYCYRKLRVRLACVKHAASVRSEPGSNSHLKLVVSRTVFLRREIRFTRTNFYIARFHSKSHHKSRESKLSRNPFWANQTGSGMFHPNCQRAGNFLACRKEYRQTPIIWMQWLDVNTEFNCALARILFAGIYRPFAPLPREIRSAILPDRIIFPWVDIEIVFGPPCSSHRINILLPCFPDARLRAVK